MKLSGTKSPLSLSVLWGFLMFYGVFSCSMEFFSSSMGVSHVLMEFFHVLWGFLMFCGIFSCSIVSCSFEV